METSRMTPLRQLLIGIGGVSILLTLALLLRLDPVLDIIPWKLTPLSSIFLASIVIAAGLPPLWIGLSNELAGLLPGTLDFMVMYTGLGIYSIQLYLDDTSRKGILGLAIVSIVALVSLILLFFRTRKLEYKLTQPMPFPVKISYGIFAVVLILVGGSMILKTPEIFPWPLSDELSVVYGWIFLGASTYFLYAFTNPVWGNAKGQLIGFLAYDLVLILPFINHFSKVPDNLLDSLIIYTAVVVYSGLLATYYLFINPETRFRFAR